MWILQTAPKWKWIISSGCITLTFIWHLSLFLQVVAHPISQHFITSIVFDNIPRWRTSTMKYKIFFIFMATLFYPITSFATIVAPCSSVGKLGKRPLMKFINVAASFITFLCKQFVYNLGNFHRAVTKFLHEKYSLLSIIANLRSSILNPKWAILP